MFSLKKFPRFPRIELKPCLIAFFSSAFLAFGLYNVHSMSGVTEGGVLGATLLLQHWFSISPAVSGLILSIVCYAIGSRMLGGKFMVYSIISVIGFSVSYQFFQSFDPLWPQLAEMPLLASVLGAIFVGAGAGACVRTGGAPGGDDALAMSIADIFHIKIQWAYLMCDLAVLALSLSYIPLNKIVYSLLTVVLSGQIVGIVQNLRLPGMDTGAENERA